MDQFIINSCEVNVSLWGLCIFSSMNCASNQHDDNNLLPEYNAFTVVPNMN